MLLNRFSSFILMLSIGLTTTLSVFNVQAQQSGQLVEAVKILGNRRVSDKSILKRIKTRPGEAFNRNQIQLDLQSILSTGFFDKVQTRVSVEEGARGGVVILFEVVELPLIQSVSFEGLKGIDEIRIKELLRSHQINISQGAVYDPVQINRAMNLIRDFLTKQRWSNVSVTVLQKEKILGIVYLTFVIDGDEYSFIEITRDTHSINQYRQIPLNG